MTEQQYVTQVGQQANSYEQTIQALFGLDSLLRYDDSSSPPGYIPGSWLLPGRLMTPVGELKEWHSGEDQTPDVVIQLTNEQGVIGEVKITASSQQDFDDADKRLARYSCSFLGWCTEDQRLAAHDVLLLVDVVNAGVAAAYFEGRAYDCPFVLLSMARDEQYQTHLVFQKWDGDFTPKHIRAKFEAKKGVVAVGLDRIVKRFSAVKFYDAKPECTEYVMEVLWSCFIAKVQERRMVTESGGTRREQRRVHVLEARARLEEAFGIMCAVVPPEAMERHPSIPDVAWVREALDAFVRIEQAEKDGEDNHVYWVTWSSRLRQPLIENFARKLYRSRGKRAKTKKGERQEETLPLDFDPQ